MPKVFEDREIMAIDKKKFMASLKQTLRNLGSATIKTLNNLDQADKRINEKMEKILKTS